jgi:hypothetical protein
MKAIKNAKFVLDNSILEDKILLFDKQIVGFVDSVGLSGYPLTSFYRKLLTFTGLKRDRII